LKRNDLPPGPIRGEGIGGRFRKQQIAHVNVEGGKNATLDPDACQQAGGDAAAAWHTAFRRGTDQGSVAPIGRQATTISRGGRVDDVP